MIFISGRPRVDYTIAKLDILKRCERSSHSIADHISLTDHNIKWDHFEILTTGKSDIHCRKKETLLIRDLKPALNENVGS